MARRRSGSVRAGTAGGGVVIEGADELRAALKGLPPKLAKKYMRKALRKGARPIRDQARQNAPKDTGFGASQIKVKSAPKMRRGTVGIVVTTDEGGKNQGDAFYMSMIEWGFMRQETRRMPDGKIISLPRGQGTPTPVPPKPFMGPAFESQKSNALNIVRTELWNAIKSETK